SQDWSPREPASQLRTLPFAWPNASNRRPVGSEPEATARTVSDEMTTAGALTCGPVSAVVRGQQRSWRLVPAQRALLSGSNARAHTGGPDVLILTIRACCPPTLPSPIDPSTEPDASHCPSGDKATALTLALCSLCGSQAASPAP